MYTNTTTITHSQLFYSLTSAELDFALKFFAAVEKQHARGNYLKRAGGDMPCFGLVLQGTVQVYADDINGHKMIMANVTAGDIFGEALCFLAVPETPVYICAATDCTILWMQTDSIRNFRSHNHQEPLAYELVNRFIAILATRSLEMKDRLQILSQPSLRRKITTFFSQYSARSNSYSFQVPFDRQDMASYLGTDRSALSRELAKMRDQGLICFHKNSFQLLKRLE